MIGRYYLYYAESAVTISNRISVTWFYDRTYSKSGKYRQHHKGLLHVLCAPLKSNDSCNPTLTDLELSTDRCRWLDNYPGKKYSLSDMFHIPKHSHNMWHYSYAVLDVSNFCLCLLGGCKGGFVIDPLINFPFGGKDLFKP